MKKWHYYIMCLVMLFGLTGCGEHNTSKTSTNEILYNETSGSDSITTTIQIPYLDPYEGDLVIQYDELATLDEAVFKEGKLCYQGMEYIALELSVDQHAVIASGWKINLNMLTAKWKMPDGYIVLVPDNTESSPIICTYNEVSGQIDCYLREDVFDGKMASININDFDFFHNGYALQETAQLAKNLWCYHISDEEFPEAFLVLDGEWKHFSVLMIYKDCPALEYELNFSVCNSLIFIENLTSRKLISISAEQIS